MPVALLYVPIVGVALCKVRPLGIVSRTVTPVAVPGPVLVSATVYVTLSPTLGRGSLICLLIDRLMVGGVTVAESWSSSPGTLLFGVLFGSDWSTAVTWAEFTFAPGESTAHGQ